METRTFALMVLLMKSPSARGQTTAYIPFGSWQSDVAQWEARRAVLENSLKGNPDSRPVTPGLRPLSVELLEDAFLRKHPRSLNNDRRKARLLIERRYLAGVNGRNQLNGAMAEALFLIGNPDWMYVSKPNASQHDVYRRVDGRRPPLNGQVKFHQPGKPATYARDMIRDYRAHRFFVPNDHVESLRTYWLDLYHIASNRGDAAAAKMAARNAGRVQPLGFTSAEILNTSRAAFRISAAESRASLLGFGTGIALALGQLSWESSHGGPSPDHAVYAAARSASMIGAGAAAEVGLSLVNRGALRGTLRGNVITGGAILTVDTAWSVHEHGGIRSALRRPAFYEQLGGSVSAVGLGTAAYIYTGVATSELGPWVAGPASVAAGLVVGTVAYSGGRSATSWLFRSITPELYQRLEQQQIAAVKSQLKRQIARAQLPMTE